METNGDGLVIRWQSVLEKSYRVERSTNLAAQAWTPLFTHVPGAPPMNTATDAAAFGSGPWLYRVLVERD